MFADVPRLPAVPQTPVVASWPFDMWGLDFIGALPEATGRFKFVLVAVDYFTKWVEARPLVKINEENTMKFLHDQIWCRFGLPRAVVSDNGLQFSTKFTKMCHDFNVRHWSSSVAHPQGNGQAEAANKLIMHALERNLGANKGTWAEDLPAALWAVRTTVRGPTGETPFALTYGSEAMAPAEVALATARVAFYSEEDNNLKRALDLDLLEEKRIAARMQMVNYKQKTKLRHDKKVRPRSFKVGDLVLKKVEATGHSHGKFDPNWEGPFVIGGIVREGTYKLHTAEGLVIQNTWHADHLKKYYQ